MLCLLSQSKLCIIIQIWHQVLMFHLPYVAGLLSKAVKTSVFATSSPFKDLSPAEKYSLTTGWNKTESWSKYSKAFSSFLKSVGIKWDKADNYSIVAKPNTTLKFYFISFFYGKKHFKYLFTCPRKPYVHGVTCFFIKLEVCLFFVAGQSHNFIVFPFKSSIFWCG